MVSRERQGRMNTKLAYTYACAANYKEFAEVILEGELTAGEVNPFLHEGEFFLPTECGLEDLSRNSGLRHKIYDHPWHRIAALTPTEEAENAGSSVAFLKAVQRCDREGWARTGIKVDEELGYD
jgi:predicted secreted hydrolase